MGLSIDLRISLYILVLWLGCIVSCAPLIPFPDTSDHNMTASVIDGPLASVSLPAGVLNCEYREQILDRMQPHLKIDPNIYQ